MNKSFIFNGYVTYINWIMLPTTFDRSAISLECSICLYMIRFIVSASVVCRFVYSSSVDIHSSGLAVAMVCRLSSSDKCSTFTQSSIAIPWMRSYLGFEFSVVCALNYAADSACQNRFESLTGGKYLPENHLPVRIIEWINIKLIVYQHFRMCWQF